MPQNLTKSPLRSRSQSVSPVPMDPNLDRSSENNHKYSYLKDSQLDNTRHSDDIEIICDELDDESKPPQKRSRHRTGDDRQRNEREKSTEHDFSESSKPPLSSTINIEEEIKNEGEKRIFAYASG